MNKTMNVKFAGLGGQGILTCTDILGRVVFDMGFDVKKAEVHGMSQRGGAITSDLRYGDTVLSPMIPTGDADFLIVLGNDQIATNEYQLKEGGVLITPEDFPADQLTNKRTLNVALLGALSKHMDFSKEQWIEAIHKQLPERLHKVNEAAFDLGAAA